MTDRYENIRKALARYEPETVYIGTGEYIAECVRADDGDYYLAADVDAEIERLRAEVVSERNLKADAIHACALANIRAERLAEALRDAATSMQTIADKAGRDEYLMTMDEVRGYANSRANAARAACWPSAGSTGGLSDD